MFNSLITRRFEVQKKCYIFESSKCALCVEVLYGEEERGGRSYVVQHTHSLLLSKIFFITCARFWDTARLAKRPRSKYQDLLTYLIVKSKYHESLQFSRN